MPQVPAEVVEVMQTFLGDKQRGRIAVTAKAMLRELRNGDRCDWGQIGNDADHMADISGGAVRELAREMSRKVDSLVELAIEGDLTPVVDNAARQWVRSRCKRVLEEVRPRP